MESLILITLLGLIILGVAFFQQQKAATLEDQLQSLQQDLARIHTEQRQQLSEQLTQVQDQLIRGLSTSQQAQHGAQQQLQTQNEQTARLIAGITEKIGGLERTNMQILDYSSQLQQLQNILKNPKQRGVLGEYWLATLLGNLLPKESFALQHSFGKNDDGEECIVDAAVFANGLIIPVDAKFSLENYNRMMEEQDGEVRKKLEAAFKGDVQRRIDETSKYIQPNKNTTDFAFMFVPAEGVYYHLINAEIGSGVNSQNLIEYAFKKKVMIVAPMSFYAYLQTVLFGLNQLRIVEQAGQIRQHVEELRRHLHGYKDHYEKIGNYLRLAAGAYNKGGQELRKVDKDMQRITTGKATESETLEVAALPNLDVIE